MKPTIWKKDLDIYITLSSPLCKIEACLRSSFAIILKKCIYSFMADFAQQQERKLWNQACLINFWSHIPSLSWVALFFFFARSIVHTLFDD